MNSAKLPPSKNKKETIIINIKDKPLPMKGWKNKYVPIKPGVAPTEGNYFASTDAQEIIKKYRKRDRL